MTALTLATDFYLRRSTIGEGTDPLARKHVTQVRVLRRVTDHAGRHRHRRGGADDLRFGEAVRRQPDRFRRRGRHRGRPGAPGRCSPTCSPASSSPITQPIRIGDAVIVENEWGWVEEITGDLCRDQALGLAAAWWCRCPTSSRSRSRTGRAQSTDLIGTVLLWVDYTVPVAPIRLKLEEIARASKLWDGQVVNLQVVDSNERAVQLRALVSARTSPQAWDLRCEVREQLILFLQEEFPNALAQAARRADRPRRTPPRARPPLRWRSRRSSSSMGIDRR